MTLRLEVLTQGLALERLLEPLADLRIAVFRDWPYLYDGNREYEAWYLGKFAAADSAVLVAAFDGDALVGASTGLPMSAEHSAFGAPFEERGYAIERLFYGAETILLPAYRGRGLYRQFFQRREAHARALGRFEHLAFCGVVRPDNHPLRPSDAVPLDPVWRRFGYVRMDGVTATFAWKDIDQDHKTDKPMQFWIRALASELAAG
ncbi:hypothetical protein BAL199_13278 [alpha proteobacterium BAL199]|jgi:GNAT superfamily N-acetyltransferase|nr:hypothetical protein BAL199_13278 [alpha proteobacterium BAL199]